jgi:hypothetical protein
MRFDGLRSHPQFLTTYIAQHHEERMQNKPDGEDWSSDSDVLFDFQDAFSGVFFGRKKF